MLRPICICDCMVSCVRVLKVSLRTESGFKINRACVGLKADVEAGCFPVPPQPPTPIPLPSQCICVGRGQYIVPTLTGPYRSRC